MVSGLRAAGEHGARWVMILSGPQLALAGGSFIKQFTAPILRSVARSPGTAFGAVDFLIPQIWLMLEQGQSR